MQWTTVMKRRNIVAIVFLVIIFALGIVSVVHAVAAVPVPITPIPETETLLMPFIGMGTLVLAKNWIVVP
jgi:NAD/NADP transhydrogenase beta subunit